MSLKWLYAPLFVLLTSVAGFGQDNWSSKETSNYRILHKANDDHAAKAAKLVEEYHQRSVKKWFKGRYEWRTKCDIYLHPTADSLSRFGSVGWNAPGYTVAEADSSGAVIIRRVHVRTDFQTVWEAVLPHEINHAVVAGRWGPGLYKWIDEGMAGQMEPDSVIAAHISTVKSSKDRLAAVGGFVAQKGYPRGQVNVFYAQSITFVRYLAALKGDEEFVSFVDSAVATDCEKALKKHYKLTPEEAEAGWLKSVEEYK